MLSLDNAVVYDNEHFPNATTITIESLFSDHIHTFEISEFRDDRAMFFEWFDYMARSGTPMIGFNNFGYDYPMLHFIRTHPNCTPSDIYQKNESIIDSPDRFGHIIWDRDQFVPQIDLFKIHHFDNKSKRTTLKALQVNTRAETVMESKIPFGTILTRQMLDDNIIPYNRHDVSETKRFAHYSMGAINFRIGLIQQFGTAVLNWNDTKIGEEMLVQRLGEDVCFDRSSGRKEKRQTPRRQIPLSDIIFPYVRFENPEFQRVHQFMLAQTLTPEDLSDPDAPIKTKGVFTDLKADVGGLTFHFGTGGVHASVERQRFIADGNYALIDIDVEGLYPNVAIVNRLAPAHLGEAFIAEYAKIPDERKLHAKGTYQNAALKLAANGPWGKSNSAFSVFYDPAYAMTIPINGQLMICMLVEQLIKIPTLQLIQANTDGVTYRIKRDYIPQAKAIEDWWQQHTCLKLEYAEYNGMWIRDVNNYIARDINGKLKQKGAYWHPDPLDYANSISNASPPCWYKDFNPVVVPRAAVAAIVDGIDPEIYLRTHTDPFDFMCRVKLNRGSELYWGDERIQSTTRYYVARNGRTLRKISPPPAGFEIGMWKKAPRISSMEYHRVMRETGYEWDERVCTKSKTKYDNTTTNIESGWLVQECNSMSSFSFDNVNYDWYLSEVRKLII